MADFKFTQVPSPICIVGPGDSVLLCFSEAIEGDQFDDAIEMLKERFPGVSWGAIDNIRGVLVQRAEKPGKRCDHGYCACKQNDAPNTPCTATDCHCGAAEAGEDCR